MSLTHNEDCFLLFSALTSSTSYPSHSFFSLSSSFFFLSQKFFSFVPFDIFFFCLPLSFSLITSDFFLFLSFPLKFFSHPSHDTVRPLDVRITSEKRPLSAGHKVQLTCRSSGSRPAAVITWWLGSKRILHHISDQVSESLNVTTSILHFVPSSEENGQTLYCRADHSILPDSALEDSWTLNVHCKYILFLQVIEF